MNLSHNHYLTTVTNALTKLNDIEKIDVDLPEGRAYYEGKEYKPEVNKAIEICGFEVGGVINPP